MEALLEILDRLPGAGTLYIECVYMPSNNEQSRLPGRVHCGQITLRVAPSNYREFLDWLQNDTERMLCPMKISWSSLEATIHIDLDLEQLEVHTRNSEVVRLCMEYSQRANMRQFHHRNELLPGRIVRRSTAQAEQNWNRNRIGT